jgi:hypothetical protein
MRKSRTLLLGSSARNIFLTLHEYWEVAGKEPGHRISDRHIAGDPSAHRGPQDDRLRGEAAAIS